MSNNVELKVKVNLEGVIKKFNEMEASGRDVGRVFDDLGDKIGKTTETQTKKTTKFLDNMRSVGRNVADQLKRDFRSLLSLEAIQGAMSLGNQFRGSIKETLSLSDAIRKLGGTFGIASSGFSSFQTKLVKGLGEIGLNSDVATNALQGLSQTPVRGENNLLEYTKNAGMLAAIGGEKGQEGGIAKGMSGVIQSRGGDPNDMKAMRELSENLRRTFLATGKGPAATLEAMSSIFEKMPRDLRKTFSSRGVMNLGIASNVGGPNATKFLEQYLGLSKFQRAGLEARGVGKLFGEEGLNPKAIKAFYTEAQKLGGGDLRIGLKAMGIESDEAAEGFTRLVDSLDRITDAQAAAAKAGGDLQSQYQSTMGLQEAFSANINRLKATLAKPLAGASQGLTNLLQGASKSTLGSAGVAAGGGVIAALLAGYGGRGISKMLGGGMTGGIAQGALGGAVAKEMGAQPVYVVNADEIGAKMGLGGAVASGGGAVGGMGMAGAGIAAAGLGIVGGGFAMAAHEQGVMEDMGSTGMKNTPQQDANAKMIEDFFSRIGAMVGIGTKPQKVIVETNERQLKVTKQPNRGASTGP